MVPILEITLLILFAGFFYFITKEKKKKPINPLPADITNQPAPSDPPNNRRKCFHIGDIGDHAGSATDKFDANEWLHIPMVLATGNLVDDIGFSCEAGHNAKPTKAGINRMIDSYAKKVPAGYPSAKLLKSRVYLGAPQRGLNQILPEGGKALIKALKEHSEVYVGVSAPSTTLALVLIQLKRTNQINLARKMRIVMLGKWNFEQDPTAANYIFDFCKDHKVFLIWGQWKQYFIKNTFPKNEADKWVKEYLGKSVWGSDLAKLYPRLKQLNGHLFKESDHVARMWMLRNLCGKVNKGNINNPMDFKKAWFPHMKQSHETIFEDEWRKYLSLPASNPEKIKTSRGLKDNATRIRGEMFGTTGNWMGKQLMKFR